MSACSIILSVVVMQVTPSERFESMMKKAVPQRVALAKAAPKLARVAYRSIPAPAPALNQMQTATAIAAATAAINTSLDGVEAGVSVSPCLLAGSDAGYDCFVQPTITLAALASGGARLGAGLSKKFGQEIIGPMELPLPVCVFEGKDVQDAFEKHRLSYLQVCEGLALGEPSLRLLPDARRACGEGHELEFFPAMAVLSLIAGEIAEQRSANPSKAELELREKTKAAGEALKRLHLPTVDSCWSDEQVDQAADIAAANATTWNAGVSANVDLLPIQWGFAGDSRLTNGQYRSWEARGELRGASAGREVAGALGFTRGREELGKPLSSSLSFQVRASAILGSLSSDSVRDACGRVQVLKGVIPPHLVGGVSVTGVVALTRPDTQRTPFDKLEVTPYIEAHFGDKLAVRLGIPVRGVVVTRAAVSAADATPEKPASAEVRDLQWSIPPTITTVIKAD